MHTSTYACACIVMRAHPDCVFHIERIVGVTWYYVHGAVRFLDLDGELTGGSD